MNQPPARDALVDCDGLDERYVIKHFAGKTAEQARRMFADKPGLYCEDLTYMSNAALEYYLPAAWSYLTSAESIGDWDCATGVLGSLSCVVNRAEIPPTVRSRIRSITHYVAVNLAKFDIDLDDDWMPDRIAAIRNKLSKWDGE